MFGEKNRFSKLSIIFITAATILFAALIVFLINVDVVLSYVQENSVNTFKIELEEILDDSPDDYEAYSNLVDEFKTDYIVIKNEKLIYSSVGSADIEYIDKLFSHGYIYKSIYEYEGYTIWMNMYENSVISYINISILTIVVILLTFMFIILVSQRMFLKRVSKPLIQLSYLIKQLRKRKVLELDDDLDIIAHELVSLSRDVSLNLKNVESMYNEIEKEYRLQNDLATEQLEHLKTALHEVKNPLLAIKTSSLILSSSNDLTESDRGSVEDIEISTSRAHSYIVTTLNNVVDNISDIYNELEEVDIKEIVMDICEQSKIYSNNNCIEVIVSDTSFTVLSNRLKLQQVISNLIHNAFIYSPNNSKVEINLENECLKVTNSIKAIEEHGNGFGLKRVKNICKELDISVHIKEEESYYSVTLKF